MRKFLIGLGAAGFLACATAYADKIVLDLKDYDDDLMKDLDRTVKYFEPDIMGQNKDGVTEDAKILIEGFRYTEDYFTKKGSYPDAVKWSRAGQAHIEAALKKAANGEADAAAEEAREAVRQCKNCHDVYKPEKAR